MKYLGLILEKMKKFLAAKHWEIIIFLWVCGFALGFWGFSIYYPDATILDRGYLTIQLVLIESGNVPNPPLILNIARFFLPILAAQTSIIAFKNLFVNQTRQIRLRFSNNHAVVFGNGPLGEFVCKVFLEGERQVAYICSKPGYYPKTLEDAGIVLVSGDLEESDLYQKANLANAACVFAFCEDDSQNIKIAISLKKLEMPNRKKIMPCILHVRNGVLGSKFIDHLLEIPHPGKIEIDVVNISQLAARTFTERSNIKQAERMVFFGFDSFCEQILIETAIEQDGDTNWSKEVVFAGDLAAKKIDQFLVRYPELRKHFNIEELKKERSLNSGTGIKGQKAGDCLESTVILVREEDLDMTLESVLTISRDTVLCQYPIYIILDKRSELEEFIFKDKSNIHFLGILDEVNRPDILLDIKTEQMAKEFHHHYIANSQSDQDGIKADWASLDEAIKESNRCLAQKIREYLNHFHYRIISRQGFDLPVFSLSDQEIEYIASREHQRWLEEKESDGWRYGLEKNIAQKTNPFIKNWEDLSEEEKKFNYEFVRIIPEIINQARLQIHKDDVSAN